MKSQETVRRMDKTFQVIGLFVLLVSAVTANIQLVGNGYEGVVVAVDADVDVDLSLLSTLEIILTNASATLFAATKNQLYFKEFIVLLPENWPMDHDNVVDVNEADIFIDVPNESFGDTPYVIQYTGCGQQGKAMHLTPAYILNKTIRGWYGKSGTVFTHEWARLRYGVFGEYPTSRDETFYPEGKYWWPARCSIEVSGLLENVETSKDCQMEPLTGRPEDHCRFVPDVQGNLAVSSILFATHLDTITEFCDNATTAPDHLKHNRLANNRQNKLCLYQSVWEVMRGHPDFIGLSHKEALPSDTNTRPRFRYVQAQPPKVVLVLDTSFKMKGRPLDVLRQATNSFILSILETGSYLGIVSFADSASTLAPVIQINYDVDRETLADALPYSAHGSTSIGAGLRLGLEEMKKSGIYSGGSIILITNGKEDKDPLIDDVTPAILQAGVVVHSISYGQQADIKIPNLSRITGGRAIFYSGMENSTALLDGLASTVTTGNTILSHKNISISILTEANTVTPDKQMTGTFYIDSTIGNDTTLTFSYTGYIQVDIKSPNGPYNPTNVKTFSNSFSSANVLRIVLDNDSHPGQWFYRVTTNSSRVSVLVNIQSKPRGQGHGIIKIDAWLSQKETIDFTNTSSLGVFARVVRGTTPIINASAIATVETPCNDTFDLVLLDYGRGTDVIGHDGIYSGLILATDFCADGRYNVKISVAGNKEYTKIFTAGTGSGSKAARPPSLGIDDFNMKTEPLEDFQRVATAGEFRLSHYSPFVADARPPGRIVDFRAKMYVAKDGAVTLEWTAVGGDMDRGQAAQYIIYKSPDVEDIISNLPSASRVQEHQVRQGSLASPSAAGERETFVVFLEELESNDTQTVYLSISAVDEAGNEGQASNLVAVSDARRLALVRNNVEEDSDSDSSVLIWAIVVSLIFGTITIAVIVVGICRYKRTGKLFAPTRMA